MTIDQEQRFDAQVARRASGALRAFNEAGALASADVHVAQRLSRLTAEQDEAVLLAVALAVRAVRLGSVCLDVATARATTSVEDGDTDKLASLPWPETDGWLVALESSSLVAVGVDGDDSRPLRLRGGLLYLDRYWRQEQVIATGVDERSRRPGPNVDEERLAAALTRLFPRDEPGRQRLAAAVAAHRWCTVLAGGPGTGKTTTIAKLLAVLHDQRGDRLRIALAAPTGKAAARLQEAARAEVARFGDPDDRDRLGELSASTIHRLLGPRRGARTRFWHDRDNRLPYDVLVVDEASMVSLTLMSRLLDALRADARLILVGDPDQLASVEAGAVLGDLVNREAPSDAVVSSFPHEWLRGLSHAEQLRAATAGVVTLTEAHRFKEKRILELALAIRGGDPDAVLDVLASGGAVELIDTDPAGAPPELADLRRDVLEAGRALTDAAMDGRATEALSLMEKHRLLCAHREGRYGVSWWSRQVEEWLGEELPEYARDGTWYVGRPLLVTTNDYDLRLYNGDTGVVVAVDGSVRAAFRRGDGDVLLPTSRLSEVQTVHAMSVHRSQGSQFERVTLVLPPAESPLLTKELFYTAVTRAKEHVRVVGTQQAVRAAVTREIQRASGLARR